jgi:SAM-dependent methyltransferase
MKHTKIFFPDNFCECHSDAVSAYVRQEMSNVITDKITLFAGFRGNLPDLPSGGKLYYAVPEGYRAITRPKIYPFKTVAVGPEALPFPPGVFEVAAVSHYLEFLDDNRVFLNEIYRVLKRDGKLTAVVFNGNRANFRKDFSQIRSLNRIVADISEASFRILTVCGIKGNSMFPLRSFKYKEGKYGDVLIGFLSLISDVLIISADKSVPVPETCVLAERYGMV